ncbi:AfsR/SARP family transcriptional regulator [Kutzneria chonburiensis]|uniref:Tetratricopeptide repeat protein n=1 Tax=Kutzneria chonburiensis TaxID=1483604 RepID=A0ABV6MMW6_9PSEU|nr:tetratricopeptide repeat protein [Kutzneria chonburiensis]
MELGVLGPLRIHGTAAPSRRMTGLVLGVLALRPNTAVPVGRLTDWLWRGRPPASASSNLRTHVAELRGLIRTADGEGPSIEARQGRYTLRVTPDQLDALRFDVLFEEGRRELAAGRPEVAAGRLELAVGLWRGPVLDGLTVPDDLRHDVERLAAHRIEAIEDWIEARLALGRHAGLAAELDGLVTQYPLRERLWGQLMTSLYVGGRQAEALGAYRRLHALLDKELGVQPGPAIRDLHQRMLRGDPLSGPAVRLRTRPQQLPRDPLIFVGRDAELRALSTEPVSAISGTAGVGKTALALRWAHQAASSFPDGCLYADLRGFGPQPAQDPVAVLDGFLRSLGVEERPRELDELAARYRTELADRRLLVLLDNAESAEQVRPLLPGDSASRVVVTSRDSLAGLVAREGARRLDLDLLPMDTAIALLRRLIGARVDAEPTAARELAEQCARLPLALRVAAELAVSRRGPLSDLVAELGLETRKLDLLAAGGDPMTAVRAVFSWSYRQLPTPVADAFRLLGLHPGRDFDAYAAAALTGDADTLAALVGGHLLEEQDGRYRMHDLLRTYARELVTPSESDEATTRLIDHYVYAASLAMDVAVEYEKDRRPKVSPTTHAPTFADIDEANAWLDAERANLIAVAPVASARQVGQLSAILHRYLDNGAYYHEAQLLHACAARSAEPEARAAILCNLGVIFWRLDRPREALDRYLQALDTGDRSVAVRALNNIGLVDEHLGNYEQALGRFAEAARVADEVGDRPGRARALDNLGNVTEYLGRYEEALRHKEDALAIAREIGDVVGEASTLNNIGNVHERTADHHAALAHYRQALEIGRRIGHAEIEGHALDNVGSAYRNIGDHAKAVDHHRRAIDLARETDNNYLLARALNNFGETLRQQGSPAQAADAHREALDIAVTLRELLVQARAHDGIAHSARTSAEAREHWRQALAIYRQLNAPEATAVAACLADS